VAIVDDDPADARLLSTLLRRHRDVELVGAFAGVPKATEALDQQTLEALFLGIQVPGDEALRLLRRLDGGAPPMVVFLTAPDRYLVRALELARVDFLLKPPDGHTVEDTMDRLRSRLLEHDDAAAEHARVLGVLQGLGASRPYRRHLPVWIDTQERALLVPVEQVAWIEADGKRLVTQTSAGSFTLPGPLRDLQETLDPETFIRISRSAVVNVSFVREVQKTFRGDFLFVMKDGKRLRSSASGREAVRRLLGRA
jgi:two-component system LytT family response regulator